MQHCLSFLSRLFIETLLSIICSVLAASKESLKRFEQAQFQDDVCSSIGSRIKSNKSTNRSFNTVMSQVEAEIEFERLLAGRKRQ